MRLVLRHFVLVAVLSLVSSPGIGAEIRRNMEIVGRWPYYAAAQELCYDESSKVAYMGGGGGIWALDMADPAAVKTLGRFATGGTVNDLFISGDRLYVANGLEGLRVLDVADPTNPFEVGYFATQSGARAVFVQGPLAYVVAEGQFMVVDVSDPGHPVLLGQCRSPGEVCAAMLVSGRYAYLATGSTVTIVDVGDPRNPAEVSSISIGGTTRDIAIDGNRLFIAEDAGLRIVDILDPERPEPLGLYAAPHGHGVIVDGNTAYFSVSWGFLVLDVGDPSDPVLIVPPPGDLNIPGLNEMVLSSQLLMALSPRSGGLIMLDISDPARYRELGNLDSWADSKDVRDVVVQGNLAYAAGSPGLMVLDVSNPAEPVLLGVCPIVAKTVAIDGRYVYVTAEDDFWVVDVGDPTQPHVVGDCVMTGGTSSAGAMEVVGDHVYVSGGMLFIIDVSDPRNPFQANRIEINGWARDAAAAGSSLFVAAWDAGLRVFDITNPVDPVEIGSCEVPGAPIAISVSGNHAYLATGAYDGMQVVDIGDPTNPGVAGSFIPPGINSSTGFPALDVAVVGDVAFMVSGEFGLFLVDVSDPSSPSQISRFDDPLRLEGMSRVVVSDTTVYLPYRGNLLTVDAADPANPTPAGWFGDPGYRYANDIHISDNIAYIAAWNYGLRVVDLSDPLRPEEIAALETPGAALNLFVSGHTLYLADGKNVGWWEDGGLRIIDITDPSNPLEIGQLDTPEYGAWDVYATGDLAYLTGLGGLIVVDVSDPSHPVQRGTCGPANGSALTVSGTLVYVVHPVEGLKVVDVSNPAHPVLVSTLASDGASEVEIAGNLVYVAAAGNGLQVIDVSNPDSPVEIGKYNYLGFEVHQLRVVGNMAYIADDNTTFQIMDISDPTHPRPIGKYSRWETLDHFSEFVFAIAGTRACVADRTGQIRMLDLNDPTWPREMNGLQTGVDGCKTIRVSGTTAYIACDQGGLRILDVSDPGRPEEIGYLPAIDPSDLDVAWPYAYMGDNRTLKVVDVSDPSLPVEVALREISAAVLKIQVLDDYVYAVTGEALWVFDVSDPLAPAERGHVDISRAVALHVAWPYAYVISNGDGLNVVDVSNPDNPVALGYLPIEVTYGGAYAVTVDGMTAYVTTGPGGVWTIDVSDPASPQVGGIYEDILVYEAQVVADRLYAARSGYVGILDVSDPTHPAEIAYYNCAGNLLFADESNLYAYENGLLILRYNDGPLADAGPDLAVDEETVVELTGGASRDLDGAIIAYEWVQTNGVSVIVADSRAAQTTFAAPYVGPFYQTQTLEFTLTVTDDVGLTGVDKVTVTVNWTNEPPLADAGPDIRTDERRTVYLSGVGSNDTDDGIESFTWRQVAGPDVAINTPQDSNPSIVAPEVDESGAVLEFELTVADKHGLVATDRCTIFVSDTTPAAPPQDAAGSSGGGGSGGCFVQSAAGGW